jgi:hypothetical protein
VPKLKLSLILLSSLGLLMQAQVSYENHNQVDYSVTASRLRGTVMDSQSAAIPGAVVAVFSEPKHEFLSQTKTDSNGKFAVARSVACRKCRLVIKYDSFCPANVVVEIKPWDTGELLVTLRPRGIDECSSVRKKK